MPLATSAILLFFKNRENFITLALTHLFISLKCYQDLVVNTQDVSMKLLFFWDFIIVYEACLVCSDSKRLLGLNSVFNQPFYFSHVQTSAIRIW
jgi:hypothetical protein